VLELDGSYGEGGGQILRNAVALSIIKKQPIKIFNIRAKRPNPGLRPQHLTAINCMGVLCNAEIDGLELESPTLTFTPHEIQPDTYKFDIGTAGSITLIFQACILSSLDTATPITIKLIGGTDVRWSPSCDYFKHVFLPLLQQFGIQVKITLEQRGYYPKGGGVATLVINPTPQLKSVSFPQNTSYKQIKGIINIANLPEHIAPRMKHAAIQTAVKYNLRSSIDIEQTTTLSPGTGITLWSASKNSILGSTMLGERGTTAEKIGETVMNQLLKEITSGATLDPYAIDQILPYMILAEKPVECYVTEVSNHTRTNMWLLNQFFDVSFEIKDHEEVVQLLVI
jgi:RNA 3'-phosphate cyclase